MAAYLGVKILYNQTVTIDLVGTLRPDVIFLAAGSEPLIPNIHGIDGCLTGDEILSGADVNGQRIALLGGGLIGCETADFLAERGKKVVIFEQMDTVAKTLSNSRKRFMLSRMAEHGVEIIADAQVEEIALPCVRARVGGSFVTFSGFDAVVTAVGRRARNTLAYQIADTLPNAKLFIIGDANRPAMALDAILNAAQSAVAL
jgi:pyruvate/2-oxoglutarate dehydrogenase complex dihydrolipoamide dehydrogenase (E3) component